MEAWEHREEVWKDAMRRVMEGLWRERFGMTLPMNAGSCAVNKFIDDIKEEAIALMLDLDGRES